MANHLERALFVVGLQDSGKSTALRSMFSDWRLGTHGRIPTSKKLVSLHRLSADRQLLIRLTSPHEVGETLEEFIAKTSGSLPDGRCSFACPLQPNAAKNMPDVIATITAFVNALKPERVRVIFLSPDKRNRTLEKVCRGSIPILPLLDINRVEVASIDAGPKHRHGMFLADFFDFT